MEVATTATYSQWQEVMSKTSRTTYYYNPKTGKCLWHLPSDSEETLIKVTDCGPNKKQNGREGRRIERYM